MTTINVTESKAQGLKKVGEWGCSTFSGFIAAKPADYNAVKAAYDAIDDGDLSSDVLVDVIEAGGVCVRE